MTEESQNSENYEQLPEEHKINIETTEVELVYFDRFGSICKHSKYNSDFLPAHQLELIREAEDHFKKPEDWSFFIKAIRNSDPTFIFTKLIR